MPQLVRVHDQLALRGWQGLAALPSEVIRKALAQVGVVAEGTGSTALAALLDQLRQLDALHPAAAPDPRSPHDTVPMREAAARVEVLELDEADFAQMEREWAGSQHAALPEPAAAAPAPQLPQAPPPATH
jgi:hypothetical protein